MGVSINWGPPIAGWLIIENPISESWFGLGTTVLGNLQLSLNVVANELIASQSDLMFVSTSWRPCGRLSNPRNQMFHLWAEKKLVMSHVYVYHSLSIYISMVSIQKAALKLRRCRCPNSISGQNPLGSRRATVKSGASWAIFCDKWRHNGDIIMI